MAITAQEKAVSVCKISAQCVYVSVCLCVLIYTKKRKIQFYFYSISHSDKISLNTLSLINTKLWTEGNRQQKVYVLGEFCLGDIYLYAESLPFKPSQLYNSISNQFIYINNNSKNNFKELYKTLQIITIYRISKKTQQSNLSEH